MAAVAGSRAPLRIRAARPEEAGSLSDLALRSKAFWGYDKAFLDACQDELTVRPDECAERRATVGEVGGAIAGFYTLEGAPPEAELGLLYVDPAYIGRGVGRALWQHAVARARDLGIEQITIDADPFAADFYVRMGAVRVGEVQSGSIPGRMLPQLAYAVD